MRAGPDSGAGRPYTEERMFEPRPEVTGARGVVGAQTRTRGSSWAVEGAEQTPDGPRLKKGLWGWGQRGPVGPPPRGPWLLVCGTQGVLNREVTWLVWLVTGRFWLLLGVSGGRVVQAEAGRPVRGLLSCPGENTGPGPGGGHKGAQILDLCGGGPPKTPECITNCVFRLTCLTFSPLQSTRRWLRCTYQGAFSAA